MDLMAYLECKCGQGIFVKVNKLKDTQVGGVVEEVAGWRCFECGEKVETGELLKLLEIKRKRKELDALQKDIDDADQREKGQGQAQGQQVQNKSDGSETRSGDKSPGKDSVSNVRRHS